MKYSGLIRYGNGKLEVLISPAKSESVPDSVFIARETPYGNKVWLRRILEECEGFIYWLDKHFMPTAFETIWEAADGNRISEIRVLSLKMDSNVHRKGVRAYQDLQRELKNRSIDLEWRVIDSQLVKDTHDRWVVGARTARNVPDVGTIFSGNHSELNRSDQAERLRSLFEGYWEQAIPVS